ncbi:molybdopterin-binding protein, partial [Brevibacterium aurantiacum]
MSSETNGAAQAQATSQADDLLGAGRTAAVIIASTSAARGEAADTTGPILVDWLRTRGYETPEAIVVRDGEPVGQALRALLIDTPEDERPRIIVTSGGTGLAPDDRTPEFT